MTGSAETTQQPAAAQTHPRTIGWVGTTALAMGGSNQSLFLLSALFIGQESISGQGSAAIPLLIVGLLLSWAAAPGWTELVMMWPNRVGGIAGACSEAFRPYNPVLSALTGCCYWWGWVPTCGLTAMLSASAIQQWFLPGISVEVMATALVLFFCAISLCGIQWVVRLATPIAFMSAGLAFVSALAPVLDGNVDWMQASTFHLTVPFEGWFGSLTSVMAGIYLIGFAAPAFEAATCHVGETINPNRNVPRAVLASALMAAVYFAILPVIWLGALGSEPLGKDLALVLGPTFAPVFGSAAKAAAIGFMMFNMFHGTIQPLAGAARTLSQLADDGLLPRSLSRRSRTDTPWVATLLTAGMAIWFLWLGDPIWLIAAANFTYLIGICMPSVAVWLLRRDAPNAPRPYRAPNWTVAAGLAAASAWMLSAMLGFEQFGINTVMIGLVMAYTGAAAYAWRQFFDRRLAGLPGLKNSLHVKLTGAMLTVLVLDGAGYFLAVSALPEGASPLISALQDIFVAVAMLTITVGLVLPGMISHSVSEISEAAKRLVAGTLNDFTLAMEALGRGDIRGAQVSVSITPVVMRSRDEVGDLAKSFNDLQHEIERAAVGLTSAREGLSEARVKLLESNQSLQKQNQERAELVENLIEARDQAEAANLAKGMFLAKMSHEIRTPLNGVLTTAELLQNSALTPSQNKWLKIIMRSGDTLLNIIDQILDLSKLDTGKLQLETERFDLRELVKETTDMFGPEAAKKSIELDLRLPEGPAPVWVLGDSLRLRQVLTNLVSNAIKFTKEGKVGVELSTTKEIDGRLPFEIIVQDTGIGIHDGFKVRMFEPFSQAYETTTRSFGGTGLGLAIVKQIVDLLGGSIQVESKFGKGTTFRVALAMPSSACGETSQSPQGKTAGTGARPTGNAGSRKILVAEDNPVNQDVIADAVRELGYQFALVDNGKAAVEHVQSGHYGLVLMDCRMPVMDGFEATKAIRKAESESGLAIRIPIIAVSANAMKGDREKCLACGMDDHMAKPFTLSGLRATLGRWIPKTRAENNMPVPGQGVMGPHAESDSSISGTTRRNTDPSGSPDRFFLDAEYANSLRTTKPDLWRRLKVSFLKLSGASQDALSAALQIRDTATVKLFADSLKFAAANVGATRLAEVCSDLQAAAHADNLDACRRHCAELAIAVAATREFMENEVRFDRITEAAG
jgi:two-component system, sensor histidine kinase